MVLRRRLLPGGWSTTTIAGLFETFKDALSDD